MPFHPMYSLPIILPSEWKSLKVQSHKGGNTATPFQKVFLEGIETPHLRDQHSFHRTVKAKKTSSTSLGVAEREDEDEGTLHAQMDDDVVEEEGSERVKRKEHSWRKRGREGERSGWKRALKDTERGLYPEFADRVRQQFQGKVQRRTRTSPPRDKDTSRRPICSFFLRGQCKKGDDCPFRHEKRTKEPCKFFIAGTCRNGDACPFSHDLSEVPCKYFHVHGFCGEGDRCRFSHVPLSEDERMNLIARTRREQAGGTSGERDHCQHEEGGGEEGEEGEEERGDDDEGDHGLIMPQEDGKNDGEEVKERDRQEGNKRDANGSTVSSLGQLLSRFVG
jgi:hypothetical protein